MLRSRRLLSMAAWSLLAVTAPAMAQLDSDTAPARKPSAPAKEAPKDKKPIPKLDDPKDVFGPASKSKVDADGKAIETGGWSIILVVFRGKDQGELARLGLHKVQTEGGLPDAFIEKRGEATAVVFGSFSAGDDPRAIAELKRVQEIQAGGSGDKPYRFALLAPPINRIDEGSIPQYNLSQARVLFGDAAVYTLQVAVYGREDLDQATGKDLAEVRRAAEQAAVKLRQEGELAFYFHGPRRSMVTIGVFDTTDFDPEVASMMSVRLKDAMRRHPQNLYNGAGIKERRKGEPQSRMQASSLVAIPTK